MLLRKLAVLLMVVAATLVLASGVALAADFIGTSGNDELTGTEGNDYFDGRAGDDRLYGLGGDDDIYGDVAPIGSTPARALMRSTLVLETTLSTPATPTASIT